MRRSHAVTRRALPAIALACMATVTSAAFAGTSTVTYVLDDVWLLPDDSHPGAPPRQMTGTIEWTYVEGDFENGTGEFVELSLPWWSETLPPLAWTIETSALEITMPGKYHDLGVDVTLRFLEPLSLDRPSTIDTVLSAFEIEVGIARSGHVISGSAIPDAAICPADLDGDLSVGFGDILAIIGAWGPCPGCPEDLSGNDVVDFADILAVIASWGPCSQP